MRKGRPKIFGLIGYPITHSLSPVIFDYLFRKHSLKADYHLFPLKENQLKSALAGIQALGIAGVNVTAPYKERVIPYLDDLDKSGEEIRAVNVISNRKGKLIGYNTDVIGIKRTLREKLQLGSKLGEVILIGAGGAARACLSALGEFKPERVVIANRSLSKAKKIARLFNTNSSVEAADLRMIKEYTNQGECALLINATSGQNQIIHKTISRILSWGGTVFDLKYHLNNRPALNH